MKEIRAFTLVELLIAMVFSSIIVSLAYFAYSNTNLSFQKAYNSYGKANNLLLLQSILNRDCNKALLVTFEDDHMVVEDIVHKKISYVLTAGKVIREVDLISDTFHIGTYTTTIQYLFDKIPVLERLNLSIETKDSVNYKITAHVFYTNKMKMKYSSELNDPYNGN